MDLTLVYMLAGLSKRFGGKPKGLAKIGPNSETLLEYSLNQALPAGFTRIIFIVSEKTRPLFEEKFGSLYKGIPIKYALQEFDALLRSKPWGTADALCSAEGMIESNFIVCNGDDIYGKEPFEVLANHLIKNDSNASVGYFLGNVLSNDGGVNRGIFRIGERSMIKSLIEVFDIKESNLAEKSLAKDNLCSMNMFALTKNTLNLLGESLRIFKTAYSGDREAECLLPQEISSLIEEGKITMKIYQTKSKWLGITYSEDEEKARESLKLQANRSE